MSNPNKDDSTIEQIQSEEEDHESTPPDYEISTYPADFTLEVLHSKWKADEIVVPDFQRAFVWKQTQASRLIESFLVGLPVPAVFLYTERRTNKYMVIDGQQRLRTIFSFFDGSFGTEQAGKRAVFRLTGLNQKSRFHEMTYGDLSEEDQLSLRNSVLRAFIVQQLNPEDDTSMYHIFERLNTGGTLLANQEIRNCVLHGTFSKLLEEINQIVSWRQIYGKDSVDTRKRDVELILRFLAMQDISGYEKPMKEYLSKFMRAHRYDSVSNLEETRRLFKETCHSVLCSLGPKPFHVRSGLNAATFDSVMTAFAKNLDKIPQDIQERYRNLINDETFQDNTRSATTDVDVVQQRIQQAHTALFEA